MKFPIWAKLPVIVSNAPQPQNTPLFADEKPRALSGQLLHYAGVVSYFLRQNVVRNINNKSTMQKDNMKNDLFATEFAEQANALELVGSYDTEREVWVGADGALAAGPTVCTFQTYQNGRQVDSGTDTDY